MTTEQDIWSLLQISKGLADAPPSEILSSAPWLQEAVRNIEAALERAEKESRRAA